MENADAWQLQVSFGLGPSLLRYMFGRSRKLLSIRGQTLLQRRCSDSYDKPSSNRAVFVKPVRENCGLL